MKCWYYFILSGFLKQFLTILIADPVNIYFFKANKCGTRRGCEICSKLTMKTPERRKRHFFTLFTHCWPGTGICLPVKHIMNLFLAIFFWKRLIMFYCNIPQIRYTFVGIFDVDGIFRVNFFLDYRVKRQN